MVQRCALAAIARGRGDGPGRRAPGRFRALLGADPDVASRLDAAALDACFDLEHHLRHAPAILERALGGATPMSMSDLDDACCARSSRHTLDDDAVDARSAAARCERYDGKVRDCYIDRERGERIIVVTDRLSAFDVVRRHDPVQGAGAEPARAVLVRGDHAPRAEPHARACPIRT